MDRRTFIQSASAAALAAAAPAQKAAAAPVTSKMIGLQVGAVSFVDEGVEKALDEFQNDAAINTLFIATFTYGRGIAGRQVPGQPLPDHGKQTYDTDSFYGGAIRRWIRSTSKTQFSRNSARPTLATTTCSNPYCPLHASVA